MCTANSRVKDPPIQPRTWTVPQNRIIFPMSQKPNKALIPCSNQTWQWTIHHLKTRGCSIADLWLPEGISPQFQIHLGKLSSFTGKVASYGDDSRIRFPSVQWRKLSRNHHSVPRNHHSVPRNHHIVPRNHHSVPRNHHIIPKNHQIVPREIIKW